MVHPTTSFANTSVCTKFCKVNRLLFVRWSNSDFKYLSPFQFKKKIARTTTNDTTHPLGQL